MLQKVPSVITNLRMELFEALVLSPIHHHHKFPTAQIPSDCAEDDQQAVSISVSLGHQHTGEDDTKTSAKEPEKILVSKVRFWGEDVLGLETLVLEPREGSGQRSGQGGFPE